MVNIRGRGHSGWSRQLKMSLDEDAGGGYLRLEEELLNGLFRDGTRSDALRLMVRHFGENPPPVEWKRRWWRKSLGESWPEVREDLGVEGSTSQLAGGGQV